jgi:uncharacterized protein
LLALAQIGLAVVRIDRNEEIGGDGGKRRMSLIDPLQHKGKREVATYQGLGARLRATLDWMTFVSRHFVYGAGVLAMAALATSAEARSVPGSVAPDGAPWQSAFPARPATYAVEKISQYVPMPDGVRIAADIYLPKGLKPGTRVPTLLMQTRYYRSSLKKSDSTSCAAIPPLPAYFTARGYAFVEVDVRGTGASFGIWKTPISATEIHDAGNLIDWITEQPWSSGSVGAFGQSYAGSAAEMLLLDHRPALKAVAQSAAPFDVYNDLYFPGGILNNAFRLVWGNLGHALDSGHPDQVPGRQDIAAVCTVDADTDGTERSAAIADHVNNFNSIAATGEAEFRDDDGFKGLFPDPVESQKLTDRDAVPFLSLESTADSGQSGSGVNRFINSHSGQQRLILAAGDHGQKHFYAPGVTSEISSSFDQNAEFLAFMDRYVAGKDNGYEKMPRVRWFTTGANAWHSADSWPQPAKTVHYSFAVGHRLSLTTELPSSEAAIPGDAQTGIHTRWRTSSGGGAVFYEERSATNTKLLAYTSAPLDEPLEVTGSPAVTLSITDATPDGDYFAYLEEVDPVGHAFYVGEGELRASKANGEVPYLTAEPLPSGLRRDRKELKTGQPMILRIGLIPFSHRFATGSRMRVVLAGSNQNDFQSPRLQGRRWTVKLGEGGSAVDFPVAAAQSWPPQSSELDVSPSVGAENSK